MIESLFPNNNRSLGHRPEGDHRHDVPVLFADSTTLIPWDLETSESLCVFAVGVAR
jgi:hypothetical protein